MLLVPTAKRLQRPPDRSHHSQATDAGRLKRLAAEFGLPSGFDVHDPRNLALICQSCNGPDGKGSDDLSSYPVVINRLNKAERLRSIVIEKVHNFAASGKTAEALVLAREADLGDARTRQAFEQYAPAVVQKLALVNEDKAEFTYFITTEVRVDEDLHQPDLEVGISLRGTAKRAAIVLEDVCGGIIEDIVQEPILDLFQQIYEKVQHEFEAIDSNVEPITAASPDATYMRVAVDSLDFGRAGAVLEFTFGGEFEADLSASLVRYSLDGSELVNLQGEAYVTGRYSFVATWNTISNGELDTDDCYIEPWQADLHI